MHPGPPLAPHFSYWSDPHDDYPPPPYPPGGADAQPVPSFPPTFAHCPPQEHVSPLYALPAPAYDAVPQHGLSYLDSAQRSSLALADHPAPVSPRLFSHYDPRSQPPPEPAYVFAAPNASTSTSFSSSTGSFHFGVPESQPPSFQPAPLSYHFDTSSHPHQGRPLSSSDGLGLGFEPRTLMLRLDQRSLEPVSSSASPPLVFPTSDSDSSSSNGSGASDSDPDWEDRDGAYSRFALATALPPTTLPPAPPLFGSPDAHGAMGALPSTSVDVAMGIDSEMGAAEMMGTRRRPSRSFVSGDSPAPGTSSTHRAYSAHDDAHHGAGEGAPMEPKPPRRRAKKPSAKTPKMHACIVCRKQFPRPSGLATHMNTHSGAKPYKCPVQTCNKSFAVRSNAKRHLRTHRSALASSPVLQTLSLDASTSDSIARTIRRSSTPTSAPYPPRRSSTVSALHPAPARLSPPPTPLSLSLALPAPHLHSRGDMAAGSPPPPPLATKPRGDAHTHTAPSNAQGYAGLSADTGPASCFPASLHSRDNAGWLAARGVFAAPGDFEIDLPWAPRVSVPMVAGPSRPRYHDGFAAGASWGGKYEEAAEAASDRAGEGGARRWTDMDPRVDSGLGFPYHPAEWQTLPGPVVACRT